MATFQAARHILRFIGNLWLQSFKRALWVAILGIIVTFIRVSLSQSGAGGGLTPFEDSNDTNGSNTSSLVASCPVDVLCSDLPPRCLNCSYSSDCVYGDNTTVSCYPLTGLDCQVHFNLPLRLCIQIITYYCV